MVLFHILYLITVKTVNTQLQERSQMNMFIFTPLMFMRLTTLVFIFSGLLAYNINYYELMETDLLIYSGLFRVSSLTCGITSFLLTIGGLILIARPGLVRFMKVISTSAYKQYTTVLSNNGLNIYSAFLNLKSLLQKDKENVAIEVKDESATGFGSYYSIIISFSTLGSLILMTSSDLLSMYLSIELQSFGLYVLCAVFRNYSLAVGASLKYFLLGALASCLILLGCGITYSYTGQSKFSAIFTILSTSNDVLHNLPIDSISSHVQGINLGLIIILIGLLFKIGAAPLHNWSPDVYNDSPTLVTMWLTIIPKISLLIFILYIYIGSAGTYIGSTDSFINITTSNLISKMIQDNLSTLILISSLLSLIIGTVLGLSQTKIKRLLAYSTISHLGFLLLSISIISQKSIESFLFYLIQYTITNLNIFIIILALGYLIKINKINNFDEIRNLFLRHLENSDLTYIKELRGQFKENLLLSVSLFICLFSMAGIPPLIGFFSKQMVLYSSIMNGYYFMSLVCIITSVISTYYYLTIIKVTLADYVNYKISPNNKDYSNIVNIISQNKEGITIREEKIIKDNRYSYYFLTTQHTILISILTLLIFLFIFNPTLLLNSFKLLSLNFFIC